MRFSTMTRAACLCGYHSQDGAGAKHGFRPMGGWRFGNTIDGAQANVSGGIVAEHCQALQDALTRCP